MLSINIKSHYCLLNSLNTIDDIIKYFLDHQYNYAILCDDNMYGTLDFINKCQINKLKPIIGLELNDYILFCTNYDGYLNLIKIYSLNNEHKLNNELLNSLQSNLVLIVKDKEHYQDYHFDYQYLGVYSDTCSEYPSLFINPVRYFNQADSLYLKYLNLLRDDKNIADDYHFDSSFNIEFFDKDLISNYDDFIKLFSFSLPEYSLNLPKFSDYNDTKGLSDKEYLENLAINGLKRRMNNRIKASYKNRLLHELDVINKMGYSSYFLIVYDFILYAKKNNILVGPGRGSACSSLVAYSLGITEIDPMPYNLLFERLLNEERVSLPDIDTDFPDDKREEVLNYCRDKYGLKNVCNIITFDTFGIKSSIRDMGRVLNIPNYTIDSLCRKIKRDDDDFNAIYQHNLDFKLLIDSDLKLKELYQVCQRIIDYPRHTSIHAAGVIIASEPLDNLIPLDLDDYYISSYEAKYLEKLGLLKIDFLSIHDLTMINNILVANKLSFNDIPLDDKKTYLNFSSGNTNGIFQFESSGMKRFLMRLKPSSFPDIYNANAFYRPGPSDSINLYLKRRKYDDTVYLNDDIKNVLVETKGIMVYQEQIMLISQIMAGFSLGKADILRRAISKKNLALINSMREEFISGAKNLGYQDKDIIETFSAIVKFAAYGFNKAHAIAYSLISYKMMYLKTNYPKTFYLEILNNGSYDDKKKLEYFREIRNCNIKLVSPDINQSSNKYISYYNSIILPINSIIGISNILTNKIIDNRENGYCDIYEFVRKNNFDKKTLLTIISSGLLDSFGLYRKTLYDNIDALINYSTLSQKLGDDILKPDLVNQEEFSNEELIKQEKDSLGFYLTNHPVKSYKDADKNSVDLINIASYFNKIITTYVIIDSIRVIHTKKGDSMAFIEVSDEEAACELVLFPETYKEYANLEKNDIIKVVGRVEKRDDYQIVVNKIEGVK